MARLERFLEPPRLRTLEADRERRATWLELFLDLVFVAAIAEVAITFGDDPTAAGFGRFLAIFVPIGWAWAGFTFYATRFDTDDLLYRVLTLLGMFGVAGLASAVPEALSGGENRFVLAYVFVRVILLTLYARAYRHVERARPVAKWFLIMFGIAVVDWLVSLALPTPWKYGLWAVALLFEHAAPIRVWRMLRDAPIHPAHIPERFGLLVIIVLGEAVIAVVLGTIEENWTALSLAAAFAGFLAAAAIWWLYFDFFDASVVSRNVLSGMTYVYAHYFVTAGIAALGVGVKLTILSAAAGPQYDDIGWVAAAGTAMCMGGLAVIQLAIPPALVDADVLLRLALAALAGGLAALTGVLSPVAILWILAGALVAQIVVELGAHERHGAAGARPV